MMKIFFQVAFSPFLEPLSLIMAVSNITKRTEKGPSAVTIVSLCGHHSTHQFWSLQS